MVATKIEGGESLAFRAAQNFTGANKDLKKAFGFGMRVLTPYGGGRTPAQQAELIRRGLTSTMKSDHVNYVAVDIDNQRSFRNVNQAKFLAILKAWGWRNITINGLPFPSEPWHFVNDNKARVTSDPNPNYQVYYCVSGPGKGWYYEVGRHSWRRTRNPVKRKYWVRKFGYGGSRTFDQLEAIKASGNSA